MSSIPPNVVGPIAQSGQMQQNAARALESERDQQTNAATTGNRMNEKATESVDEAGNERTVYPDAEGGGSEGRELGKEQQESSPEEETSDDGIRKDDEGQLHVDLEA